MALDTDRVCARYEEADRLRLGVGKGGPWLRAHLAQAGTHYLVPDPADYYWPDPNGKSAGWQCTALLRMSAWLMATSGGRKGDRSNEVFSTRSRSYVM
jgi:hypothetical protein